MIFVTVGTHEQQFDRLIKMVDLLKADEIIAENVVIQTGFSDHVPTHCEWKKIFSYREMSRLISNARIVITHGGPSSFIAPLQMGKVPIVVPRQKRFGEHINDHQLEFCKAVAERKGNVILVEDIADLQNAIVNYDQTVSLMTQGIKSNNKEFVSRFENIVNELMKQ